MCLHLNPNDKVIEYRDFDIVLIILIFVPVLK